VPAAVSAPTFEFKEVPMLVKLERWAYTKDGVFGTLHVEDLELFTVERPWRDNIPRESAIPIGEYRIVLGRYNRGGYPAYELLDVPGRSLIKIHRANTMDDLLGCIGLGTDTGYMAHPPEKPKRWAVMHSRKALHLFMERMDGVQEATLVIVNTDSLSK
jgi:hypothetical protein